MGLDVNSILSVAVNPTEHQVFTNAWRKLVKYGTDYNTLNKKEVLAYAQAVYKDYPELLKAAKQILS